MRSNPTFADTFATLAAALNYAQPLASGVSGKLLECFNRAYARGYNLRPWEDAWAGATVTPSSQVIDYSQIADARRFEVWTKDPRVIANEAQPVDYQTDAVGIHLVYAPSTVFVLRLPSVPKFTTTAWASATSPRSSCATG